MAGRWELVVDVRRDAPLPPFLQIAHAIVADIQRGRLRPGDRLPGSRQLAAMLQVHRNTVLAAIGELIAEGWIETSPARGTFVTRSLLDVGGRPPTIRQTPRKPLSRAPFPLPDAPAPYRPPELPRGTLNLSSGAPDVRLVPAPAFGRAYRRVLALRAADVLGYGGPDGHPALRSALAAMMVSTRGLTVAGDDVVITRGSQMGLTLAARALLRPGDTVAVEAFGYRPAWEAFRAAGAIVAPVPIDRDGIDVDALKALAGRTPVRAVYVTPHHQYPTTVTLKAARRVALLAFARSERCAIIEDDYDHEFHYEGRPVLPLASADHGGHVVYIGTLSKVLAPAFRIGYIVAARPILRRVSAIRSLLDTQGDLPTEAALAAMIEDGELQRHIARARRIYAARRDVLATCLHQAFGEAVQFTVAAGGMALWVRFRTAVDVEAWARHSLEHGVSWYTGRRYALDGRTRPFARLGFAALNDRELADAVRRMAAARQAR